MEHGRSVSRVGRSAVADRCSDDQDDDALLEEGGDLAIESGLKWRRVVDRTVVLRSSEEAFACAWTEPHGLDFARWIAQLDRRILRVA